MRIRSQHLAGLTALQNPFRWRLPWLVLAVLLCACQAPVGVERVSLRAAQSELTKSILSTGELSEDSRILLRRFNREREWETDPEGVLAELHAALGQLESGFDRDLRAGLLDSVAELAFAYAIENEDRRYYFAAAFYAWLYLFPEPPALRPSSYDRGVRLSADIYNRALALALAEPGGDEIAIRDDEYELPFGTLAIDLDEATLKWGTRELSSFDSLADLSVHGLNNRYRPSGLGAPLAARVSPLPEGAPSDGVFDDVRVPITAVLHFDRIQPHETGTHFTASLSIIPYSERDTFEIRTQEVPVEAEPTAALALQLTENPPWEREIKGFLQGDLATGRLGLVSMAPYRPGRIPIVLVHGTASSPGRWADLLNDLQSDPVVRGRFQFWLFTYNTGNPILYSAWLLREAIRERIESLDPAQSDPALQAAVVLGHSQGGLLAKLAVVDAGSRFWDSLFDVPPEEVDLEPESRELMEGALLVEPSPFVTRVIFLSTPHHGSALANRGLARLAGRLVRSPANLVSALGDVMADDPETEVRRRLHRDGAVGNMSPRSRFIRALAPLPIAPGVHAHSIMGVRKDPIEEGSDGVVSYQSAHLDGVDSELVVRSGHSSQSNPVVIWEVRRILLEHLSDAIEVGIVEAPPADLPRSDD